MHSAFVLVMITLANTLILIFFSFSAQARRQAWGQLKLGAEWEGCPPPHSGLLFGRRVENFRIRIFASENEHFSTF